MNTMQSVVVVGISLVVLVALSVVAAQIGGVRIRTASTVYDVDQLVLLVEALEPGTPITIQYSSDADASSSRMYLLMMRMHEENKALGEVSSAELASGSFRVLVPCGVTAENSGEESVRLVLIEKDSEAVVAQGESVQLLPDGPECLFGTFPTY